MERNRAIELFRFICALEIAVYHAWDYFGAPVIRGGYLVVDYYLILSGFLMYKHLLRELKERPHITAHGGKAACNYLFIRFKGIYFEYFIAFVLQFILLNCVIENVGIKTIWNRLIESIWTLLLLNEAGIGPIIYNGAAGWYLSALLIASWVVYYIAVKSRQDFFCLFFAPAAVAVIYSIFYNGLGHMEIATEFYNISGTVRAFAGLCLGCISYHVYYRIKDLNLTLIGNTVVDVFVVGMLGLIVWIIAQGFSHLDFVGVMVFALLIILTYARWGYLIKLIDNPVSAWLGKLSFIIFLNHRFVLIVFLAYFPQLPMWKMLVAYVGLTFIFSVALLYLQTKVKKFLPVVVHNARDLLIQTD